MPRPIDRVHVFLSRSGTVYRFHVTGYTYEHLTRSEWRIAKGVNRRGPILPGTRLRWSDVHREIQFVDHEFALPFNKRPTLLDLLQGLQDVMPDADPDDLGGDAESLPVAWRQPALF